MTIKLPVRALLEDEAASASAKKLVKRHENVGNNDIELEVTYSLTVK